MGSVILTHVHNILGLLPFQGGAPFRVGWMETLTFKESTVEGVAGYDCCDKVIKDM